MYVFKIVTTVSLALIIATMVMVLISKKDKTDGATVAVASVFTVVQIMAIAGMWL